MEALLEAALRLAAPLLLAALGELRRRARRRGQHRHRGHDALRRLRRPSRSAVATAIAGARRRGRQRPRAAPWAALFAAFAVLRGADQIVVGMAVNLLALGATGARRCGRSSPVRCPTAPTIGAWPIPGLAELPFVGSVLFRQTPFIYAALLLAAASRALPGADAHGPAPARRRRGGPRRGRGGRRRGHACASLAVLVGGAFAGLAGAALSLAQSNTFTEGMTAGRGFIALAIVIFGRWRAAGVVLAALFFGATTALQFRLQARGLEVPYPLALMLPYVLTLVVLAVASGRTRAPADLGRPYRREAK